MAKQKREQVELPSDEHINENKNSLSELLQKLIDNPELFSTPKQTINSKLSLISDELKPLKDKAIPYSVLAKILEQSIGLKVGAQTLRTYCQTHLDFPKRSKSVKAKQDKITTSENSEATSFNASDELANNKRGFK